MVRVVLIRIKYILLELNLSVFTVLFLFIVLSTKLGCEKKNKNNRNVSNCVELTSPPISGTIFIDPDIITSDDLTAFINLSFIGSGQRTMYDRRVSGWITINPYLFLAFYNDSIIIEIQVNPEFGNSDEARYQAEKFAPVIGRLTTELRKDVETVWIHKGLEPFGGGNNNLLIHTDYSLRYYEDQGILEETLVHESAHTSLDSYHSNNSDWINAQNNDCGYISAYAEENPTREDIAESYLPYLAIRYRSERISVELREMIERAIPNRIKYFDSQSFKMYPIVID